MKLLERASAGGTDVEAASTAATTSASRSQKKIFTASSHSQIRNNEANVRLFFDFLANGFYSLDPQFNLYIIQSI